MFTIILLDFSDLLFLGFQFGLLLLFFVRQPRQSCTENTQRFAGSGGRFKDSDLKWTSDSDCQKIGNFKSSQKRNF